jgi:ankyrin repeat protein
MMAGGARRTFDETVAWFLTLACGGPSSVDVAAAESLLGQVPELATRNVHSASALGQSSAVAALLRDEPALATRPGGPWNREPLVYVCFSQLGRHRSQPTGGLARVARLLLDHGAAPNASHEWVPGNPRSRMTVLFGAAAVLGDVDLVRVLLEAGAQAADAHAIIRAAEQERFDCLELILDHGGDLNRTVHPTAGLPLHWLVDWSYKERAVRWLLEHGADPDERVGRIRETALHVAARRRRLDAVELLLDHGAEIDARTAGGKSAYAHALCRGFDEVAGLLRDRGADTRLSRADRLAVALVADDLDAARKIVETHPDLVPGLEPEDARILPDLAGRPSHTEAVRLLLDAGADITARGLDGGTALHQAAWFGQVDAAELLVAHGAPLEIRGDDHRSTPLGWVCHGSRFSGGAGQRSEVYARIAELLLVTGASLANPDDPEGDPQGRWLFRDASADVAAVLRRHGGRPD